MKSNLILISFLERIYKAKRKEDFSNLLEVQIYLAKMEKENRILKDWVNKANKNNYNFGLEVSRIRSNELKLQNRVDILEQEKERLKTELNNINENLEL